MVMSDQLAVGHGKVILLGEHSVVYGRPALAVAIPRGCRASAEVAPLDALAVEPWGVTVQATRAESEPEREMLRLGLLAITQRYPAPRPQLLVRANMEIPGGAGLGGSAALSVAVVRAFDAALSLTHTPDEIIEASLAWERVFHGNPSGIDSAMATRGGLMLYRRGQPLLPVHLGRDLIFVVGGSGEHGSTKAMVESVARQHAHDAAKSEQIFDAIAALVESARGALEVGDHTRLGQLMDCNQELLDTLLLSTAKLEAMCQLARQAGALGAKLTGGGGGGSMIALAGDRRQADAITQALSARGFAAFVVEVSR
jgi:mevalonate kinase